jgi:hypothetical protein
MSASEKLLALTCASIRADQSAVRKADEKLARTLFRGQEIRDKATGLERTKYLSQGSADEREALCALARLFGHKLYILDQEKNPVMDDGILNLVWLALDPDRHAVFSHYPRFEFRCGKRPDIQAALQVGMYVQTLVHDLKWKREAAVQKAMEQFKLSRKGVNAARAKARKQFAKWGIKPPPGL